MEQAKLPVRLQKNIEAGGIRNAADPPLPWLAAASFLRQFDWLIDNVERGLAKV
jgi:hypothetical protein